MSPTILDSCLWNHGYGWLNFCTLSSIFVKIVVVDSDQAAPLINYHRLLLFTERFEGQTSLYASIGPSVSLARNFVHHINSVMVGFADHRQVRPTYDEESTAPTIVLDLDSI
eukprot:scaffold7863_cov37-Cyclotella_meneghiniana.AAC.14